VTFLEELNTLLTGLGLPVETGVFSGKAPREYVVITPLADTFALHADNRPQQETQEARLSLYARGNYLRRKNAVVRALLAADFSVTARQYVGYEPDAGYYSYALDVARTYQFEEE
jgi:hypothetical protein